MLRQLRYFQSVVRNNSFSEAAEECHISQSAIHHGRYSERI
ncbi:MAG: LysR family transcriptional regulator [Oscillospiraceae bacterium]|nr:LysR family transcriptional regulator [Oscillospiraceae bacterium]